MLPAWVNDYIGIPFVEHGRSLNGWDCWGLVQHVAKEHYGKILPSFAATYARAENGAEIAELIDRTRPVVGAQQTARPDSGDLVVLTFRGYPCHIGVYLEDAGQGWLLHVLPRIGTVLDRIDSIRNNRRVEGYYRV
jgi:cell wall-associated NlpC family hydrolase